jgi:hypothetical protein
LVKTNPHRTFPERAAEKYRSVEKASGIPLDNNRFSPILHMVCFMKRLTVVLVRAWNKFLKLIFQPKGIISILNKLLYLLNWAGQEDC